MLFPVKLPIFFSLMFCFINLFESLIEFQLNKYYVAVYVTPLLGVELIFFIELVHKFIIQIWDA